MTGYLVGESKRMETGGQAMGRRDAIQRIGRFVLLCLVIGSLLGGLVGMVVAGEAGPAPGSTAVAGGR